MALLRRDLDLDLSWSVLISVMGGSEVSGLEDMDSKAL